MLVIEGIAITEDIIESYFACQLHACKGACCVEGDSGAPLTPEEAERLQQLLPQILPFLPATGKQALEAQGAAYFNKEDGEWETPLRSGAECAYTVFENGIATCGIEKAYVQGAIDFQKPISCHLYPIRQGHWDQMPALYYHRWHICKSGCIAGENKKIRLIDFLRSALIRKFGEYFFQQLTAYADSTAVIE